MPDSRHVVKSSLLFAKLVATPTDLKWSQAYNAGNLFACLSLTHSEQTDKDSLSVIGKDILNILEAEYFGLAEKSVSAIKEAMSVSVSKAPENITVDLVLAHFKDTALSVFIHGRGKIVLKRKDKIGILLEKKIAKNTAITASSGYLQNLDTIMLQTGEFAQGMSDETVTSAMELALPTDIVEYLSPQMHEQENGAQSAIVITYQSGSEHPSYVTPALQNHVEITSEDTPPDQTHHEFNDEEIGGNQTEKKSLKQLLTFRPALTLPVSLFLQRLTHRRRVYLSIALILLVLLGASIVLTVKKQADEKQAALFQDIYQEANLYYEEGKGLESLNPKLSRESYLNAESVLKKGETTISKNSTEGKALEKLQALVTTELKNTSNSPSQKLNEAPVPKNSLLAIAKNEPSTRGLGQDGTTVYVLSTNAVRAITKASGTQKESIQNKAWENAVAVTPYQGNIYILDTKKGVLKYVNGKESAYFESSAPDLSQAVGMAIDGSVWIINKNGTIKKYTLGKVDSFKLTGMDTPLKNPTNIITTIDMDHIYILDSGNNRIVQFDKKGVFKKAYKAEVLANAKYFDVDEKNKKALILSENKTWVLSL